MAKRTTDTAHKLTDKELAALEKKIAKVYDEAASEMTATVNAYFEQFAKRDAEQKAALTAGKITQTEYTQWRLTQIGRGNRYRAMRDALAERYTKANEVALAYVNDDMAKIYALNRTYIITDVVEKSGGILSNADFILYNEQAVKKLVTENPDLMPYYPTARAVSRGIDLAYGKQQITASVTSGILQGKGTQKIASDLQSRIKTMSRESAVRAARTAVTNAQNSGRLAAMEALAEKGAIAEKVWKCVHDERTREAHVEADGQTVAYDEPFVVGGEELMAPGDGSLGASGWNLYNCRCTISTGKTKYVSILSKEQKEAAQIRRVT